MRATPRTGRCSNAWRWRLVVWCRTRGRCRCLMPVVDRGRCGGRGGARAAASAAEAFRSVAPYLVWKTAYAGAPSSTMMHRFWADSRLCAVGVTDIDGGGTVRCCRPRRASALVVHAPVVEYGRHHHPAIEDVRDRVGEAPESAHGRPGIRRRDPGDVFVDQADVVHATTTMPNRRSAWVAWLGDPTPVRC